MTKPDRASNHDSYMVPSLERGLRLLSVLASARTELSLSELAERLELSRSSVFRLCYTLDRAWSWATAHQLKTKPPLTGSIWPVTKSASGESRKRTAPTQSSGCCARAMARPPS